MPTESAACGSGDGMANVLQRGFEAFQRGDLPEAKRQFEQTLVTALHNLAFVQV